MNGNAVLLPAKYSGSNFLGDFREESNMSEPMSSVFVGDFRDEINFTGVSSLETFYPTPSGAPITNTAPSFATPSSSGAPFTNEVNDAYKKSGSKLTISEWLKTDQASKLLNTTAELLSTWQQRKDAQMYGGQYYNTSPAKKSNAWIWITVSVIVIVLIIILVIIASRKSAS